MRLRLIPIKATLLLTMPLLAACDEPPQRPEQTDHQSTQRFDQFDSNARAKLLERIGDINDFSRPCPLVSLDLFFEGNDDW